jgi:hypothetical protein
MHWSARSGTAKAATYNPTAILRIRSFADRHILKEKLFKQPTMTNRRDQSRRDRFILSDLRSPIKALLNFLTHWRRAKKTTPR